MRNAFAKRAAFSESVLVDTLSELESEATDIPFPKRSRFLILAIQPWVVAVLWGVLWRGGISRWFAGIAIVDSSGRLASRWRLLMRSTLLWSPFGLLILAMVIPPLYGFSSNALATSLRALYFTFSVVYLAVGLLTAPRMLHERISWTWAVPM